MASISFEQAKELVEKWEMLEVDLKNLYSKLSRTAKHLDQRLSENGDIIITTKEIDKKLMFLRCLVAVNFGVILGLLLAKILFG